MTVRLTRQKISEDIKTIVNNGYPNVYVSMQKNASLKINLDDFECQIFSFSKKSNEVKENRKNKKILEKSQITLDDVNEKKSGDIDIYFWEIKKEKSHLCSLMVVKIEDFHDDFPLVSLYLFPSHYQAFNSFANMFYKTLGFKRIKDFMDILNNLIQESHLSEALNALPFDEVKPGDLVESEDCWDNPDYKL